MTMMTGMPSPWIRDWLGCWCAVSWPGGVQSLMQGWHRRCCWLADECSPALCSNQSGVQPSLLPSNSSVRVWRPCLACSSMWDCSVLFSSTQSRDEDETQLWGGEFVNIRVKVAVNRALPHAVASASKENGIVFSAPCSTSTAIPDYYYHAARRRTKAAPASHARKLMRTGTYTSDMQRPSKT